MLLFGLTFTAAALTTDSLYALLSGAAGGWLRRRYESVKFRRGQRYFSGGCLPGPGIGYRRPRHGKGKINGFRGNLPNKPSGKMYH